MMSGATRGTALVSIFAALLMTGAVASTAVAQSKDAIDQMADEIVKRALRDAMGNPNADQKPPSAQPPATSAKPLAALAGSEAPIPLPDGAEDIEFSGRDGKLEFTSTASVAAVAAFYRSAMKPLGWREKPSVINRPNMVVVDFLKADKSISITIMQMGKSVNVSAHGAGLMVKTAAAPLPAATQNLEADEKSGLPFPKRNTLNGTEQTPFRLVLNVRTEADLASVLAFYRRELGKRNWKEETQGAVANAEQAVVGFTSPEGLAVLKLSRENDETIVALALRKTAEATKAGVVPKAGQGKLLFGNMQDNAAVITVNGKTIKVGAGVGTKAPDGPSIDLPPGKYKVSFKIGSAAARTENVEVGADETWGLLLGPGGALSLQVY